jgi:hypothetical protein
MIGFAELTTFLGWTAALNIVFLLFISIVLVSMRGLIIPVHRKMLGVSEEAMMRIYVQFLSQYKVAVLVFNVVPYLALKFMGY